MKRNWMDNLVISQENYEARMEQTRVRQALKRNVVAILLMIGYSLIETLRMIYYRPLRFFVYNALQIYGNTCLLILENKTNKWFLKNHIQSLTYCMHIEFNDEVDCDFVMLKFAYKLTHDKNWSNFKKYIAIIAKYTFGRKIPKSVWDKMFLSQFYTR